MPRMLVLCLESETDCKTVSLNVGPGFVQKAAEQVQIEARRGVGAGRLDNVTKEHFKSA